MLNEVFLIGRLGADPEERMMQNGDRVVSFSLATSEFWKDQSTGERKERTEWHRIVVFNQNLAKVAASYLKKGSLAYLQGKIRSRKWTDPNTSVDRYVTEVVVDRFDGKLVLLGGNGGGVDRGQTPGMMSDAGPGSSFAPVGGTEAISKTGAGERSVASGEVDTEDELFRDHIPF